MAADAALVLASVWLVHALAMLSPGPNVLVVTQAALADSRRAGVWTAFGIAAGTAVWSSAALFGLGVLFAQAPWLTLGVGLLGGAYLIYLGMRLWRGAHRDPFALATPAARRPARSAVQAFRVGALTNLTNPKALVFFASVFAALLPAALPLAIRLAAIGIVVANAAAWHVGLACFFSIRGTQRVYARVKPWVDRTAGAMLIGLGLRLLFTSLQ